MGRRLQGHRATLTHCVWWK